MVKKRTTKGVTVMLGIHVLDVAFESIGVGVVIAFMLYMTVLTLVLSRTPKRKRRVQTTRLK